MNIFDLYLKFEIFISKQKTCEFGKYLMKAAAEEPAKEPISKILIFLFLNLSSFFS